MVCCRDLRLKADKTATSEEIREFVRSHLARFKVPKYVQFMDAFPQTASGKIQKFRLSEGWKPYNVSETL